jgi:glycosyltransferase involved in cell wall biosynthesis
MLEDVTPVLITLNEEPNIARTLSCLAWASDIVIVDSGSNDRTKEIACEFPNVRFFERSFDTLANQWRYATEQTGIETRWLLRLDADYQVTEQLVREISLLDPDASVDAYCVKFGYAVYGQRLNSSLYPPKPVLLRPRRFTLVDRGHTEVWLVEGTLRMLKSKIIHDDRKPLHSWVMSQFRYMERELYSYDCGQHSMVTWLRHHPPWMPILTFFYCLFVKGLILNGRAGIFYSLQRTVAEGILSLMILEKRINSFSGKDG